MRRVGRDRGVLGLVRFRLFLVGGVGGEFLFYI